MAEIHVRICDESHPHYPETGVLTGKIITFKFSGQQMAEMKLDACAHGGDACFVSHGQVAQIRARKESR